MDHSDLFGGLFYLMSRFWVSTIHFSDSVQTAKKKAAPLYSLPGDGFSQAENRIPDEITQIGYLQNYAGYPVYTGTTAKYLTPGERKWEALL